MVLNKVFDSYIVTLDNCRFIDVSRIGYPDNYPINIGIADKKYPSVPVGNIHFNNCYVAFSSEYAFLGVDEYVEKSSELKNITGLIRVYNPYFHLPPKFGYQGALLDNINLDYKFIETPLTVK
jgi:hypothetical protein